MIIYKITHRLNGHTYVGQTTKTLEHRWKQHCSEKRRNYHLYNAIKKYGKDAFTVEEVAQYDNMEDLNNAEAYYVEWYNCLTPNGYNLKEGGGTKGKFSEEIRKKIGEAGKGRIPWNKGKTGIYSEETLKKMSRSSKGRKHTIETRLKISNAGKGRIHSDETKLKISALKKGKSNGLKGKRLSKKIRQKMSLAAKGKPKLYLRGIPRSEETKRKISAANKGKPGLKGKKNGMYRKAREKRLRKNDV
jgi:group I intron endonuclease